MASTSNLFEIGQTEVENTNVDTTRIFKEIHKEIGDYLTGQGNDADSMDSISDFRKLNQSSTRRFWQINCRGKQQKTICQGGDAQFCTSFEYKSRQGR